MKRPRLYYTTTELADLCGVSQPTIWRAIQAGKINTFQTPGGHFRIYPKDAKNFLRSLGVAYEAVN